MFLKYKPSVLIKVPVCTVRNVKVLYRKRRQGFLIKQKQKIFEYVTPS